MLEEKFSMYFQQEIYVVTSSQEKDLFILCQAFFNLRSDKLTTNINKRKALAKFNSTMKNTVSPEAKINAKKK